MAMAHNNNEIQLETQGPVTVLDISGDITAFSESSLGDAYRKASAQGAEMLLLKIDKEAYINSGGIAVLIQVLAQTRRNNQHVAISGISDHFKKIFNMVGITKFADVYDTTEQAIQALS